MAGPSFSIDLNLNVNLNSPALVEILHRLGIIEDKVDNLMVDLSGVRSALDGFKAEVAAHATKIETQIQQLVDANAGGNQAEADAIAEEMRAETAALQALDVRLDSDDPATPPTP